MPSITDPSIIFQSHVNNNTCHYKHSMAAMAKRYTKCMHDGLRSLFWNLQCICICWKNAFTTKRVHYRITPFEVKSSISCCERPNFSDKTSVVCCPWSGPAHLVAPGVPWRTGDMPGIYKKVRNKVIFMLSIIIAVNLPWLANHDHLQVYPQSRSQSCHVHWYEDPPQCLEHYRSFQQAPMLQQALPRLDQVFFQRSNQK